MDKLMHSIMHQVAPRERVEANDILFERVLRRARQCKCGPPAGLTDLGGALLASDAMQFLVSLLDTWVSMEGRAPKMIPGGWGGGRSLSDCPKEC